MNTNRIIFVKEYLDENTEGLKVPVPPIQIGQKAILIDEPRGIVELVDDDPDFNGIHLEAVPTSYYAFEKMEQHIHWIRGN